ncbi:hypothetical protein [Halorubrum sp. BOL3-1]|uniref:hypothetical protein n=1 Tax=Halorubrum sp. BOL3-1 TaxID=2497325 RepID=UPI001F4F7263|nr:hypothetical protein [Halorubrum sp. BOL3-1]
MTSTVQPCASATSATMLSPNPVPSGSVETPGLEHLPRDASPLRSVGLVVADDLVGRHRPEDGF